MKRDQYTIYHNPRCSKSRATLNLMEINRDEKNVVVVKYLESGSINEEIFMNILKILDVRVVDICRTGEKIFKELGLKKDDADYKIFEAMLQNPILIERPIVIKNNKVGVIGRPPENILKLMKLKSKKI